MLQIVVNSPNQCSRRVSYLDWTQDTFSRVAKLDNNDAALERLSAKSHVTVPR